MIRFGILLPILLVLSCEKPTARVGNLKEAVQQMGDTTSPDYYLFIPLDGCSGCVDESMGFLRTKVDNSKITFVLASDELKVVKLWLDDDERAAKNVLVDTEHVLKRNGLIQDVLLLINTREGNWANPRKLFADSLTYNIEQLSEFTE
jgi:hypothetical protein